MDANTSQRKSARTQRWSPYVETSDGKLWFQRLELPEEEAMEIAHLQAAQLQSEGYEIRCAGIQTDDCGAAPKRP
jgi:hypothetical protein